MRLILTLAQGGASMTAKDRSRTLGSIGGSMGSPSTISIGRGSDNDWILPNPDKSLSRRHCIIGSDDHGFTLTDLSQSGISINGAAETTERESVTPLHDGDEFRIAEYVISITIVDDGPVTGVGVGGGSARVPDTGRAFGSGGGSRFDNLVDPGEAPPRAGSGLRGPGPLGGDALGDPFSARPVGTLPPGPVTSQPVRRGADPFASGPAQNFDPLEPKRDMFSGSPAAMGTDWQGPSRPDHASPISQAVTPPRVKPQGGRINFDDLIGDVDIPGGAPPAPAVRAVPPASPVQPPRPAGPASFDDLLPPGRQVGPAWLSESADHAAPQSLAPEPLVPQPFVQGPVAPAPLADLPAAAVPRAPAAFDPAAPDPFQPPVTARAIVPEPVARDDFDRAPAAPEPEIPQVAARSAAPRVMPARPHAVPAHDLPPAAEIGLPASLDAEPSPFDAEPARPSRAAAAPAPPTPAESHGLDAAAALAAFLDGAGVTGQHINTSDPEATLRAAGQIFRAMTEGFRQVLISRRSVKSEVGADQTMISGAGNNALKFAVTTDDAVRLLLSADSPGYKNPIRSAKEAADDIVSHEMAVMAGVQTALLSLLQRFDPDQLEKRLALGGVTALLPAARKARYWDQFRLTFGEISREAEDDFKSTVFGRSFAKAYSAQTNKT